MGGGDSASFRSSFSTTQQLNTNVYVLIFYFFSPGIPIGQQHLIWQSIELEDDYCLHDYSIHDGATLKLVLAMRGGPINTRRSKFLHVDQRNYFQYAYLSHKRYILPKVKAFCLELLSQTIVIYVLIKSGECWFCNYTGLFLPPCNFCQITLVRNLPQQISFV